MSKKKPAKSTRKRKALSRDAVLKAALKLADKEGVEALSMRKVANALGVEAMSLYNHVANKDEILDGIVDLVVAKIPLPDPDQPWKSEMRARAIAAHDVLLKHPWAATLIESRTSIGPSRLRYFDAVLANLRTQGFSIELAYHAFMLMDAYVYGFTLQEVSWSFEPSERADFVEEMAADFPVDDYPHIAEVMGFVMQQSADSKPNYASEFAFGLDLLLDGLARKMRE